MDKREKRKIFLENAAMSAKEEAKAAKVKKAAEKKAAKAKLIEEVKEEDSKTTQ